MVFGAQKYAVRVQVDPTRWPRRGSASTTSRRGRRRQLEHAGRHVATARPARARSRRPASWPRRRLRRLIVAYRNGAPVRLEESATVSTASRTTRSASWYNGERSHRSLAVSAPARRQHRRGRRQRSRPCSPAIRGSFRRRSSSNVLNDRSVPIRESVHDVQFTLMLTIGARRPGDLPVPANSRRRSSRALALPVSLIGTFAVMYVLGFSIDNLSLLALTLCGRLRRRRRHRDAGEHRPAYREGQAAVARRRSTGSREIGFTIVSITLSLVAVFIPVLFMGGVVGRLFREFAVTITMTILISGFVSLTLTPMLCSRFPQRHERTTAQSVLSRALEAVFERHARPSTRWTLDVVLPAPAHSCCCSLVDSVVTGYAVHATCRRASSRPRIPACCRDAPKGRRTRRSTAMVERQQPGRRDRPQDPARRRRQFDVGVGGSGAASTGPHVHRAEAARPARRRRDQSSALRRDGRGPGHQGVFQTVQNIRHRRPARQEPVPVHAAGRRPAGALRRGAGAARSEMRAMPDLAGREHRPADLPTRRSTGRHRPRPRGGAGRHAATRSQTRCTTPSARARSRPSSRRPTTTRSSWRSTRASRRDPAALSRLYVAHGDRAAACRWTPWRRSSAASARSPSTTRAAARGDDLLQSRAGRFARRRGRRRSSDGRARGGLPADDHHRLPGHGAGLPGFAAGPWACCSWPRSS